LIGIQLITKAEGTFSTKDRLNQEAILMPYFSPRMLK